MRLDQRVTAGAEAGALAGAGVILLFLFQDALRLEPLATPSVLAAGLFGPEGIRYDTDLVARALAMTTMGVRLLSYTFLHFLAFAGVGVVASFILRGTSWIGSLLGGAVFGLTCCTGVFYASRWVLDAPVQLEGMGVPAVLVANAVAGVILGGGIFLARSPVGEEDPAAA